MGFFILRVFGGFLMAKKPTYEELENRNQEFNAEIAKREVERSIKATDLRRRAEKFINSDPSKTRKIPSGDNRNLIEDLQIHQIELEMQNEELRRSKLELQAARDKYSDLYDLVPVGYITVSEKGLLREINLTAATLLGKYRNELIKQPISKFIISTDQNTYYLHRKLLFETGEPQKFELRMVQTDKLPFWVQLDMAAAQDEGGAPVCRIAISDITKRKKAEERLNASEKKSLTWLEYSPVCTKIVDLDFNLQYMSAAGVNGLNIDDITEFYGKPYPFDFYPKPFKNLMRMNLKKVKETGEIIEQEGSVNDIDGRELWFHSTLVPVNDDEGRIDYIMVVSADITARKKAEEELKKAHDSLEIRVEERTAELKKEIAERKRVEEALRESEARLKRASDNSPAVLYQVMMAPGGEISVPYVSDVIVATIGVTPEEVMKDPSKLLGMVHPDDQKMFQEGIMKSAESLESFPLTFRCMKDGEVIWIEARGMPTPLADGGILWDGFLLDITERKQAEETLKEEKEFTEKALNTQLDTFFVFSPATGKAIRWNKAFEEVSGYSSEEIAQMKAPDSYYDQQDLAKAAEAIAVILENGSGTIELEFICKNGKKIPFEYVVSVIYNELEQPENFISIGRDITERKIIEEALRKSEAQKGAILDASIDILRYVDKDMKIIWGNKTNVLGLDMSLEDLVDQTCYEVFVGRNTPCEGCPTVRARETGKIERVVMHQPKVKGIEGESYWDVYCVPLKNEAGEIENFIQIARNITDQKKALEHIHALTQQLMKSQENERQMISRELHDRVGQDLSTLRIGLDTLIDNQPGVLPETRQRISELSKMLQDAIMVIRDLSYDLRPPSLDQLGLVRTILEYAHDFSEKTGLSVDVTSAGMDHLRLDSDTEINLYRLIQEGLNNINKHARANSATIRLIASFPNIILRIEDDGEGFDLKNRLVAAQNEKRMGLRSMEERASLLNGAMTLKSRPGKGTKVLIEVPYEEKKSES